MLRTYPIKCLKFKSHYNFLLCVVCCFLISIDRPVKAAIRYTDKSVLSSGQWVKVSVSGNGIYQISYSDLKKWGFNDPSKVKIYGYGGALLSENLSENFIDDLIATPCFRNEQRGAILFYAQGPTTWKYAPESQLFVHENNYFSTKGFYFITANHLTDIQPIDLPVGKEANLEMTSFPDYTLHESELVNLGQTGRGFYGEDFRYSAVQNFSLQMPGIIQGKGSVWVEFAAKAEQASSVTTQVNGKTVTQTGQGVIGAQAEVKAYEIAKQTSDCMVWETNGTEEINIKVSHKANGKVSIARLNFIRLNVWRKLQLYSGYVQFRNDPTKKDIAKFNITLNGSDAGNVKIWDITRPEAPRNIITHNTTNSLSFIPGEAGLKEYVAFDITKNFPSPQWVNNVANQNLHALPQTDMVIIVPSQLSSEAERLAAFHRQQDNLHITVVTPEAIYNEYSSGTPDATAFRRFLKMFADREKSGDAQKLRYLLLFGDATYDYRLVSPEWQGTNFALLPSYQSSESLSQSLSYISDDYFGYLIDDQSPFPGVKFDLQLGIGRFPVRTLAQARIAVDKVIAYTENKEPGNWKNALCFVADDGDSGNHLSEAESTASMVENTFPKYVVNKVYTDTYKQVINSSGESYPDAKKRIMDLLNDGLLMVNYTGHGSPQTWSNEDLMNISDIQKLYLKRLPVFVTATCDYSRMDDIPTSAGEELFLHPKGGAIALLSTTRVVYGIYNLGLNKSFTNYLLSKNKQGERYRLGDIVRKAKCENKNTNTLKFVLLGDPALKLVYPGQEIRVTDINGHPITENKDTLKAKSRISVHGEVLLPTGEIDNNFNGFICPKIFDSIEKITSLDNDGDNITKTFNERKKVLYIGKDSVRNGKFSFEFRMPKEINYSNLSGMMNFYAYDNRGNEASGYFDKFLVGGIDNSADSETEGPQIHALYLNSKNFKDRDMVNETPLLVVQLEDESGINVSGSIGHSITATIDGKSDRRYILNNYFEAEPGAFGKGHITYTIPEMEEGEHTLTFKVWDTENNSSEKKIYFVVKKGLKPEIFHIFVDKNPAQETTCFYLNHNRPNSVVLISVEVYDTYGTMVWSHTEQGMSDMYRSFPINWDLTDKSGKRLPSGIYLYRANLSTDGLQQTTKSEKIIIQTP